MQSHVSNIESEKMIKMTNDKPEAMNTLLCTLSIKIYLIYWSLSFADYKLTQIKLEIIADLFAYAKLFIWMHFRFSVLFHHSLRIIVVHLSDTITLSALSLHFVSHFQMQLTNSSKLKLKMSIIGFTQRTRFEFIIFRELFISEIGEWPLNSSARISVFKMY